MPTPSTQLANHPSPTPRRLRALAAAILWSLLLILAVRLTMTESVRESLAEIQSRLTTTAKNHGAVVLPQVGPAVTIGFACLVLLLTGLASWCAAASNALTPGRLARFALLAGVLLFGAASTLAAANRFYALTGLFDIGMALCAGWAISILCHPRLLGDSAKRLALAALIAVLASWCAKGLYQRFIDIPDTIAYYQSHREEALASQGIQPDDPDAKLFESRMMSKEIGGFLTLSNVMAAGMIGLMSVLAGTLAMTVFTTQPPEKKNPDSQKTEPQKAPKNSPEISVTTLLTIAAILLLATALAVTFLTASRGGSVLGLLCVAAAWLGIWKRQWIINHRRPLLITATLLALLATTAVIFYGIRHDSLPSKSLMFRWHYWTASVPMIEAHKITGVGLNNFGDYYTAYKRPTSPEDVKDPHSFFIRLAAEMGLPAAALVTLLLLWMLWGTTIKAPAAAEPHPESLTRTLCLGILFCLAWWLLHYAISEAADDANYSLILCAIWCCASALAFAGATVFLARMNSAALRAVLLCSVAGAVGMLLYDQINMALVTGPVAMLFWILLGLGDSYTPTARPKAPLLCQLLGIAIGAACTLGALSLTVDIWHSTFKGDMRWDSNQYAEAYIREAEAGNLPAAERALDDALARSPRAIDLLRQRILVRERLHEPVTEDMRRILRLDRANARIRVSMGLENSDLPKPERIAMLEDALRLDSLLTPDEPKRLTDEEKAKVQTAIASLGRGSV